MTTSSKPWKVSIQQAEQQINLLTNAGADPGFQVRGAHFKKSLRAKIFGAFRLKNHDFTQKKSYFFSNFRGGGARAGCAPLESAPEMVVNFNVKTNNVLETALTTMSLLCFVFVFENIIFQ